MQLLKVTLQAVRQIVENIVSYSHSSSVGYDVLIIQFHKGELLEPIWPLAVGQFD